MILLGKTGRKLAWLKEEIAKRQDRARKLVRRLEAMEPHMGDSGPGFRLKFMKYIHEIANEREDEARLLTRVEAIEKRHRDTRLRGRLAYARQRRLFPRANPAFRAISTANREEARAARKAQKESDFLLLLIVLWYFFVRQWRPFSNRPAGPEPR